MHSHNIADLQGAYNTLVEGGISFFDSSELYGSPFRKQGFSAEQMLGKFSNENFRYDATVATKYAPGLFAGGALSPRFGRRGVVSALEESLERLERGYVDVYQVGGRGREARIFDSVVKCCMQVGLDGST